MARLEKSPQNVALYDDLAVAYDKTGQHDKAIETILRKEAISPGLYETYANLGTFYIHNGQFREGLEQIAKAIEINPDAHFGRERYQKLLVEYVLSKRSEQANASLPLSHDQRTHGIGGFARFVLETQGLDAKETDQKDQQAELAAALKGVLGMLRFGKHDSPVLLEATADLLLADQRSDAKRLAARAFLKAAFEVEDEKAKKAYRKLAEQTLALQTINAQSYTPLKLSQLEKTLRGELKKADEGFERIRRDEQRWIRQGADVERLFADKYYPAEASSEAKEKRK